MNVYKDNIDYALVEWSSRPKKDAITKFVINLILIFFLNLRLRLHFIYLLIDQYHDYSLKVLYVLKSRARTICKLTFFIVNGRGASLLTSNTYKSQ